MSVKIRNSNIELLRIVCMCFVIGSHTIMQYKSVEIGTAEYYIGNILRSFFMVAVNCFVIISGYFGINLNLRKLIKMSIQVSFYSISIYIITVILGIHEVNIKKDILILFPIITKRYWYITVYFVLCLISPLLNIIIENISKNQFRLILLVSFILFYALPTLLYTVNAPTITSDAGYGIVNFICLYFLGRFIKLYYKNKKTTIYYGSRFVISSLALFLANHILTLIFGFPFSSFISYDTVFSFISAFMIFMIFEQITIKSNLINNLAKYSLVAFIIHMHPTLFDYLFSNVFKISSYSGTRYLVMIFIIPIVVYISSWIIEFIRVKLFDKLENKIIDKILNIKSISEFLQRFSNKYENQDLLNY